jgi:CelD/BcsL family acetyltransferase involved in cellulose biosynthesis
MLDAELIDDPAALAPLVPGWDALAVTNGVPMAAPAWMLGSWEHVDSPGSELRVVAVRDGDELVGIAPWFTSGRDGGRVDYRILSATMPRSAPLAVPGREWEVAAAVAQALAAASPAPDVIAFEGVSVGAHFPIALREQWPGRLRPPTRRYLVQPSPTVSLAAGSLDGWLASKSSNFRGQMRRIRRQFDAAGGSVRMSTADTLQDDLATFLRLHAARWEHLGDSSIVADADRIMALFESVGRAHVDDGRFRLHLLEVDGEPISAQVFAAAGGEVLHMNGGWDERYARLKPSLLCILAGLEDAFERGDARMDLGPGTQPYKLRFADGDDPVAWTVMVVPGRRLPLTFARLAPSVGGVIVRDAVKRAATDEQREQLRSLRARLRR